MRFDPFYRWGRMQFTPDGKGVVYPIYDRGAENLWVHPLSGGPLKQFTFFKAERIIDFAFSYDGRNIALLRGHENKDVVLIGDATR